MDKNFNKKQNFNNFNQNQNRTAGSSPYQQGGRQPSSQGRPQQQGQGPAGTLGREANPTAKSTSLPRKEPNWQRGGQPAEEGQRVSEQPRQNQPARQQPDEEVEKLSKEFKNRNRDRFEEDSQG